MTLLRAVALGFFVYSSAAACTAAAHGKESPMFGKGAPSPQFEQVVHVSNFGTRKEGIVVLFEELPMECTLPPDAKDFEASVGHLAAAWREHKAVSVTFQGASTIVKVAAPK